MRPPGTRSAGVVDVAVGGFELGEVGSGRAETEGCVCGNNEVSRVKGHRRTWPCWMRYQKRKIPKIPRRVGDTANAYRVRQGVTGRLVDSDDSEGGRTRMDMGKQKVVVDGYIPERRWIAF